MTREIAQNPSTPPKMLRELATKNSAEILQALTENPSTPIDLLLALAEYFPANLWENPILSLMILEDPNFLQRAPFPTREALAQSKSAPGWFLSSVIDDPTTSVRDLALAHPNLPTSRITDLVGSPHEGVRRALAHNPSLPHSIARCLLHDSSTHVSFALLKNFSFEDRDTINEIIEGRDQLLLRALIENQKTPAALLEEIEPRVSSSMYITFAMHPNTSLSLLTQLSKSPVPSDLPIYLARHHNASEELLQTLSLNNNFEVRRSVICNKNVPTKLADQMIYAEPALLHSNANVSVTLLEDFASREEPLRYAAAHHPKTPASLLSRLANDESLRVQSAVAGNPSTPESTLELLSSAGSIRIVVSLASNPKTPSLLLSSLTKSGDLEVRLKVASNPNLSGWGFRELAQDAERDVRLALCKNAAARMDDLLCLRHDTDTGVRRAAALRVREKRGKPSD